MFGIFQLLLLMVFYMELYKFFFVISYYTQYGRMDIWYEYVQASVSIFIYVHHMFVIGSMAALSVNIE